MGSASTRQWTDEDTLRALGEWGWAPTGSEVIEAVDYRVVVRPESFDGQTTVERIRSDRRAAEIAADVHALARERRIGAVIWNVSPTTTPSGPADHLLALGGTGAIAVREDGSASLFGAASCRELRGRGAYRAIQAARTRWAWQHGVPVLLAKARLATSAPIMKRLGFTLHGYTRSIAVQTR